MKTYTIKGQEFVCPRYVNRVPDGWQTRLPGKPTKFFGDSTLGGTAAAHQAAVTHRIAELPLAVEDQAPSLIRSGFRTKEIDSKEKPLGIPGAFLVTNKDGSQSIRVKVKKTPQKTIRVTAGIEAAIFAAKAVRAEKITARK